MCLKRDRPTYRWLGALRWWRCVRVCSPPRTGTCRCRPGSGCWLSARRYSPEPCPVADRCTTTNKQTKKTKLSSSHHITLNRRANHARCSACCIKPRAADSKQAGTGWPVSCCSNNIQLGLCLCWKHVCSFKCTIAGFLCEAWSTLYCIPSPFKLGLEAAEEAGGGGEGGCEICI